MRDGQRQRGMAGPLLASLLVPLAGLVLGIRYLLRERIGPGLALILVGFACLAAWGVVASAALVVGTEHALKESLKHRPTQTERLVVGRYVEAPLSVPTHPVSSAERAAISKRFKASEERSLERTIASTPSKPLKAGIRRELQRLRAKAAPGQ